MILRPLLELFREELRDDNAETLANKCRHGIEKMRTELHTWLDNEVKRIFAPLN